MAKIAGKISETGQTISNKAEGEKNPKQYNY